MEGAATENAAERYTYSADDGRNCILYTSALCATAAAARVGGNAGNCWKRR